MGASLISSSLSTTSSFFLSPPLILVIHHPWWRRYGGKQGFFQSTIITNYATSFLIQTTADNRKSNVGSGPLNNVQNPK
jgi:hypothetical protein